MAASQGLKKGSQDKNTPAACKKKHSLSLSFLGGNMQAWNKIRRLLLALTRYENLPYSSLSAQKFTTLRTRMQRKEGKNKRH